MKKFTTAEGGGGSVATAPLDCLSIGVRIGWRGGGPVTTEQGQALPRQVSRHIGHLSIVGPVVLWRAAFDWACLCDGHPHNILI